MRGVSDRERKSSMDKLALIDYFDEIAPRWDSVASRDPDLLRCLMTLCIAKGARVLDVGCGTGMLTPYILEKSPASLVSIDISPAMIAIAKERHGHTGAEFLCGDVMELNRPGEFDCTILYDTFPQFENRGSLIRHMHRLLAADGRLMICNGHNRHVINAPYKGGSVSIPLPAAKTLASTVSQYFDVDTVIDSPSLYAVSGVQKIQ